MWLWLFPKAKVCSALIQAGRVCRDARAERCVMRRDNPKITPDLGRQNFSSFDGLFDIFIRYNISCNSQRFILFFSLTKKGNGHLYIPITANHFQAIKVFDSHDDGNIFSPPCANIQISDSSSDNLNVLKISICLEESEESSSFRKKYIINRIFIQNSSGLFFEYQHEDKPILHLFNTYP